ncbi:DUF4355 domain-containing protein [Turicibacter sanguinis]|uniref:DUF4355 domain-containing protein n=1 Tax=Turicibacter sanguinis TaxID=154288 RepID=UPI00232FD532|nr:DUF4355 domain-containing protein [Turicibacter sanguinis]MDB8574973.1 DUF4355 domain-containing protein [Turicibacter sanguinis]MDB8578144.1 DUF4355 domain-containing protein [Turicibacter sanguinis]MDB8583620.1 DUF4355 domain-containing protein [Turicibacter sanguinis]MDB8586628.1 DUF4355 domain-containing protein [Turicibacter sanguinis]MDB8597246.1 DUF4355 domain-containing protein [Turicibacter sanguinis]
MGEDVTNTNANPGAGEGQETQVKTFDELLNDESYKSEYDKRLAQELASAKSKWETEQQRKLDAEKTEAEKMASMNAKEKEEYQQQKREKALEEREREITARELKATAYETLTEKGLPKELAEILNYTDADQCKASIDVVEKTFNSALTKAVNEKLKGTAQIPKKGDEVKDTPLFGFSFTGVRPKK